MKNAVGLPNYQELQKLSTEVEQKYHELARQNVIILSKTDRFIAQWADATSKFNATSGHNLVQWTQQVIAFEQETKIATKKRMDGHDLYL